MSEKLPIISGKQAIRIFEKIGYIVVRQRGSHIRLLNDTNPNCKPLTVPLHKELDKGLLRRLIRDSGLTPNKFIELF